MRQGARGRLGRLERRQPQNPYAHVSDAELERRVVDIWTKLVAVAGLEQARAMVAGGGPPGVLELIEQLAADRRTRPA
jgi:hypothetical protein